MATLGETVALGSMALWLLRGRARRRKGATAASADPHDTWLDPVKATAAVGAPVLGVDLHATHDRRLAPSRAVRASVRPVVPVTDGTAPMVPVVPRPARGFPAHAVNPADAVFTVDGYSNDRGVRIARTSVAMAGSSARIPPAEPVAPAAIRGLPPFERPMHVAFHRGRRRDAARLIRLYHRVHMRPEELWDYIPPGSYSAPTAVQLHHARRWFFRQGVELLESTR